jgi:hypothetical protein
MPVSPELLELVRLLDEEGFGMLAGELLTETALGREVDGEDEVENSDEGSEANLPLSLRFADVPPPREPVPEAEQLAWAAEFLHLRLVEPVRRLAEAERLAGGLALDASDGKENTGKTAAADSVRIKFTRPTDEYRPALERLEPAGRADTAEALAAVLRQLAARRG